MLLVFTQDQSLLRTALHGIEWLQNAEESCRILPHARISTQIPAPQKSGWPPELEANKITRCKSEHQQTPTVVLPPLPSIVPSADCVSLHLELLHPRQDPLSLVSLAVSHDTPSAFLSLWGIFSVLTSHPLCDTVQSKARRCKASKCASLQFYQSLAARVALLTEKARKRIKVRRKLQPAQRDTRARLQRPPWLLGDYLGQQPASHQKAITGKVACRLPGDQGPILEII